VNGLVRHLAVVISLAALAGLIPAPPYSRAAQTAPPQAGVVVRFGDGSVRTACVDLGEDGTATGEQVIRNAGLDVTIAFDPGAGTAVCKIDQEGCDYPREGCFCQCTLAPGQPCRYWSYYHLGPNGWAFSNQGASTYTVRAGAVEGWSWGPGGVGQGIEPPVIPFAEICTVAAPLTPTPTPSVTATPTATTMPTDLPTATPAPAGASPTPMIMPVASSTPPPRAPTQPARTATPTGIPQPAATVAPPTDTPQPAATVAPPTDTPQPAATVAPPTDTPVAQTLPVAPTTQPPTAAAPSAPTSTPTLVATRVSAPAGGIVELTVTPAALYLPLVARNEPEQPEMLQVTQAAPLEPATVKAAATPVAAEASPIAAADAADGRGVIWFLAFSVALAGGLLLARMQKGRRDA
jgi:hypothetical protein